MSGLTAHDLRTRDYTNAQGEPRHAEIEIDREGDHFRVTTTIVDPRTGDVLAREGRGASTLDDAYAAAHAYSFKYGLTDLESRVLTFDDDVVTVTPKARAERDAPESHDAPPAESPRPTPEPTQEERAGESDGPITTAGDLGHYLDNQVDRATRWIGDGLGSAVQADGSMAGVLGATVLQTGVEFGAELLKGAWGITHLGEGAARGTVGGYATEALTLASAIVPGARLVKRLGKTVTGLAGSARGAWRGGQVLASKMASPTTLLGSTSHSIEVAGRTYTYRPMTIERLLDKGKLASGKTRLERYEELMRRRTVATAAGPREMGVRAGDQVMRALKQIQREGNLISADMMETLGKEPNLVGLFNIRSREIAILLNDGIKGAINSFAHELRHARSLEDLAQMKNPVGEYLRRYQTAWGKWFEETRAQVSAEVTTAYLHRGSEAFERIKQAGTTFGNHYLKTAQELADVQATLATPAGRRAVLDMLLGEGVPPNLAMEIVLSL